LRRISNPQAPDLSTHSFASRIPLAGLAQFNLNGIEYYKFMLDSNQNGPSEHQFSLDRLQLYTSNNPAQTITTFSTDSNSLRTLPLGHLAYTMNNNDGTGGYVVMTATGSGKFDANMYVPVSDFNQSDKYVYLTWRVVITSARPAALRNGPPRQRLYLSRV